VSLLRITNKHVAEAIQALNPHMKYIELKQHGFVLLDVNEQRAQADWFYVSTIDTDSNVYSYGALG
jgi:alkaline phosphatase D